MFEQQAKGDAAAKPREEGLPHRGDLELVREALRGSPAARARFSELMLCVPKFVSVINARQAAPLSVQELDDVAQESLTSIWRRLDGYAGRASLQTWAYRFCQLTYTAHRRALGSRAPVGEVSESLDPPAPAERPADYAWVHVAIEKLREPDLSIVRHRHFDQMSFPTIARRLEMPESTTKAAYQRALQRLRDLLGKEHGEEPS